MLLGFFSVTARRIARQANSALLLTAMALIAGLEILPPRSWGGGLRWRQSLARWTLPGSFCRVPELGHGTGAVS